MDWDGPLPSTPPSEEAVVVDPPPLPFHHQDYVELTTLIDPLEACEDYGIHLYIECVEFVHSKLFSGVKLLLVMIF